MTDLRSIPGIGRAAFELLEAAGFPDAESLAKAGVDELANELERANRILQIEKSPPVRDNVEQWITSAQYLVGVPYDVKREVEMPVNYETTPRVASMLATAPLAIPLPAKILVGRGLAVADVPPAILLNRYAGDLEVKVEERVPGMKQGRPVSVPGTNVRLADVSGTRREIDVSRIKSTDVLAGGIEKPATTKLDVDNDRVALIRGPRVETNKGRDPQSRFYIRGVMHSHPISMATGAVATLVLAAMLPIAIISSILLLLSSELPEKFGWVPEWLLVLPLCLPVLGVIYLVWGLSGSCRICGQKQFFPRMCLKNSKAHHFPGLGYILPVCFHMLVFKWFRCTYCGTPVRLKK
jgi:hypothetical protein